MDLDYLIPVALNKRFKKLLEHSVGEGRRAVYRVKTALERQYLSEAKAEVLAKDGWERAENAIRSLSLSDPSLASLCRDDRLAAEWRKSVAAFRHGKPPHWTEMGHRGANPK